jgi:hypothetical protein
MFVEFDGILDLIGCCLRILGGVLQTLSGKYRRTFLGTLYLEAHFLCGRNVFKPTSFDK